MPKLRVARRRVHRQSSLVASRIASSPRPSPPRGAQRSPLLRRPRALVSRARPLRARGGHQYHSRARRRAHPTYMSRSVVVNRMHSVPVHAIGTEAFVGAAMARATTTTRRRRRWRDETRLRVVTRSSRVGRRRRRRASSCAALGTVRERSQPAAAARRRRDSESSNLQSRIGQLHARRDVHRLELLE